MSPLPARSIIHTVMPDDHRYGHVYGFTADQMHSYAAQEVAAERERQKTVIEGYERIYNDAIKALRETVDERDRLRRDVGAMQAQIDRLMLEHCPNEMTAEQLAEWGRHQKPNAGDNRPLGPG